MPVSANLLKDKYCRSDFESCARHLIFSKLGKDKVPEDLFPNQMEQARKILKEN